MLINSIQLGHFQQPIISNDSSGIDSHDLQHVREKAIVMKLDADNKKATLPKTSVLVKPTNSPTESLSDNSDYVKPDLVEEPLLKENPHRFVLFPIEDEEVSALR